MKIADVLSRETVLTRTAGASREEVLSNLLSSLAQVRTLDTETALRDLASREAAGRTLIPLGGYLAAVPHTSTRACKQLMLAVATSPEGIPWGDNGQPVRLVFLLLGPAEAHPLYLRVLGRIARLSRTPQFVEAMVGATSPEAFIEGIVAAEEPLGEIVALEGMPTFCVAGAGHGGLAMAAHLAIMGCQVNLYNRSAERLDAIRSTGSIQVSGEVSGTAMLNRVTADPAEALDNVDVVMVVVPAMAHRHMAELLAPHLKDGQIVVLNPGRTGGSLEVAQVLRDRNPAVRPYIAETQTLLYAARAMGPAQVRIFGIKNSVPLATLPSYQCVDVLPVLRKALPQFVPGDNILKTSLDNIGAVFHPAITILNAARIEDTHGGFEYYVEGVTPAVASVLEAIDEERVAVAAALGVRAHTAREWLYLAYDAAGKTLLDAMRANAGYTGIAAPGAIRHRYISEDVPTSLVPIASIGEMLGVPTPAMRSIIHLASVMHGEDYWAQGRTVDRLGIRGMSVRDIRFLVVGADVPGPASTPPASRAPETGTATP